MTTALLSTIYLASAVLFILSLGGLSAQRTARQGNLYGMIGMVLAVGATIASAHVDRFDLIAGAMCAGAIVGGLLGAKVAMTAMPELVALLHSFVGLAAVLVGIASYLSPNSDISGPMHTIHNIEIFLGIAIGSITFTGSVIAWAKLRGSLSGRPLLLPGRHFLNLAIVVSCAVMGWLFLQQSGQDGLTLLLVMTVATGILGCHLVLAIGGADMPVVVSMLNSYSGWAAAAAGFMLSNDLLIVTGALVGSSGAILSIIMCRAMNRSILNVIFGGFGTADSSKVVSSEGIEGTIRETNTSSVAALLRQSKSVVLVPGYGMAVAKAQHLVRTLTENLRDRGINARYAIHPVAGRLPGHMNVLLAEAGVPYDIVLEMDHINPDMPNTDVILVIGANDIVNPGALTDEHSPIYGMPVIQAWEAGTVVVLKRGMGSGYAGVQNPLFFKENTRMLFGDAKASVEGILSEMTASGS